MNEIRNEKSSQYCNGCNKIVSRWNVSGYCPTCYNCLRKRNVGVEILDSSYWHRECPTCNKEITYQTYSGYYTGKHKNSDCAACSQLKNEGPKYTTLEFIEKSILIHGHIYDYSKSHYTGVNKKVIITCKKHGDFLQSPQEHLNGHGCSVCYASRGERLIRRFFEENNVPYTAQQKFNDCINPKTNRKLSYDFYVPHKNLLIEFDGSQHYKPHPRGYLGHHKLNIHDLENIRYRDEVKNIYAKTKGIILLRITYKQEENIDTILQTEIYG